MTATPWRGDERDLEPIFGPVTYSMDIVDGMQNGFLCDVDYRMMTDGIKFKEKEAEVVVKDIAELIAEANNL